MCGRARQDRGWWTATRIRRVTPTTSPPKPTADTPGLMPSIAGVTRSGDPGHPVRRDVRGRGAAARDPPDLLRALERLGPDGLIEARRLRDAYLDQQGITFTLSGRERPLPLDLVPASSPPRTGRRSRPASNNGFVRSRPFWPTCRAPGGLDRRHRPAAADHVQHPLPPGRRRGGPTNGVRIHVAGIDLIRDEVGQFRVLGGTTCATSGVSCVLENRRALAHVLPEVFGGHRVRPVEEYLNNSSMPCRPQPAGVDEPVVVVLTPGCTTPRTTSTPSWRAAWESNSSGVAICTVATASSGCAPPRGRSGSTSCIGASMTSSSTRCTSGSTRCWGSRHPQRRPVGPRRSPTQWATAWPTTNRLPLPGPDRLLPRRTAIPPNVDTYDLQDPDQRALCWTGWTGWC